MFKCYYFSSVEIEGVLRGRPDFKIKSHNVNLRMTSKLSFMSREDVERILLKNLHYDAEN
jgi:hypothetical protein